MMLLNRDASALFWLMNATLHCGATSSGIVFQSGSDYARCSCLSLRGDGRDNSSGYFLMTHGPCPSVWTQMTLAVEIQIPRTGRTVFPVVEQWNGWSSPGA
jgi:hypothetical protein